MATSGTQTFELDVSDIIEEAFDRLGIELRTGYQAKTARRSLDLLLQEWSNRQIHLWKMILTTQALTANTTTYTQGAEILDITDVVLRRDGVDTTMHRLSRAEYQTRPNKTTTGRPSQYWFERLLTPVIHLYPTPENSTDTLRFYAMERIEDVSTSQNTLDIPSRFLPALTSGLTYKLAIKFKVELAQAMQAIYSEELSLAQDEDRERVPFKVIPKLARI
jgi:hypothetical protein